MKKFQITLSLFAILLGAGFAFNSSRVTGSSHHPRLTESWFTYNGSGSVTSPLNYTEVSGNPECPGTVNMCAIQAVVESGSQPDITTSLKTEIDNDLANQTPSANVELQGE